MREIKFRAWLVDVPNGPRMEEWNPSFFSDMSPVTSWGDEFPTDDPSVVLMQYTGLKDKNGKEIYEGDIWEYDQRYKVIWKDSGFAVDGEMWISFAGNLNVSLGWFSEMADNGEVIGNIYENPELVEIE